MAWTASGFFFTEAMGELVRWTWSLLLSTLVTSYWKLSDAQKNSEFNFGGDFIPIH